MNPSHAPHEGQPRKRRLLLSVVALALVLAASYWAIFRSGPEPVRPSAAPPHEAATPPAEAVPAPAAPEPPPAAATAPRRRAPKPASEPEAPVVATAGPVLRVDSDVAGATVFVDRKYVGTTPLTTREVAPGSHQLNASAEGQDGIVREIEVGESGETAIVLEFRDVRLNEWVQVVHKHAMGSCEGRLAASVAGLRYETSNKGDAFTMPFSDLDVFEVDYLQKNLKVKRRGGKTWNFTDRSGNADNLFVFHREVTKARAKLGNRD